MRKIVVYQKQSKFLAKILFFFIIQLFLEYSVAQCPQLELPCRCAPSIYEPIAIICENAGSLNNALQAISNAQNIMVFFFLGYLK